ncbi:hypothetical protein JKF63_00905 [Porcisia hertigi]|uniref:Vacuolar protein sorting-associated protein 54 C-terminal domain-containing protein n=1 Tax=Porcisia hertigi TaxID=2761500 RepID=A0A836IAF9_9TRYP|nr:hypothetical protein JKF63_00905 [Porcisia hertigi]
MSSYPKRHTELTSSTPPLSIQKGRALACIAPCGDDAAATICAHLIVYHGFSRLHIAHALGLPSLVVEECIRNGVSSATLRTQLCNWLYEVSASNPEQKLHVADGLFRQLQEDCAADELERQRNQRNGVVSPSFEDSSPFTALDPVSQQHFAQLQHSVGQSFISILNNPGEPTTNVDWTTWLGGKLYAAFDFNGRTGDLEDVLGAFSAAQAGPESSASLLAEYTPSQFFSGYVNLISKAYQINRSEGIANNATEWRDDSAEGAGNDSTHHGRAATVDECPWPTGVPTSFFLASYDPAIEIHCLSEAVGDSLPAATLTSSPAPATIQSSSGAAPELGTSGARDSVQGDTTASEVVDVNTFAAEYEYLESRNKELRAWESEVERCLLQHVKHRSEDFFATSCKFSSLSGDARSVWADARVAREGGMRAGEHFVADYLRIGTLYRRRQNLLQLHNTATAAQQLLRLLGDVENWAALPERDFGEVLTITSALLEMELAVRGAKDAMSSSVWRSLLQLRCLAEVPRRVKKARKDLEGAVLEEYCRLMLSGLGESETGERVGTVCQSVTRLGVLHAANHLYLGKIVELLHAMAQETLVSLLMNTGTLNDAKANELLAVVANTAAVALPETRQRLCAFVAHLNYQGYRQVLQQFVDVLVDFVTHISQNWGFLLTGGLRTALAMYDNCNATIETATKDLLGRVCGEAETLIASLLEEYAKGPHLSSMTEVAQLVRVSVQFPMRVTNEVAGRLVSLLREGLKEYSASTTSLVSSTMGSSTSSFATDGWEPASFALYRPTKVIGTSVQRLAKRFFRHQHSLNREKVTMVTAGETWTAIEVVHESIQQQVGDMCTLEAAALQAFRLRSLRVLFASCDGDGGLNRRGLSASSPRVAPASNDAGDLLSTGATKLYVRVRCSSGDAALGNGDVAHAAAEAAQTADVDEVEGRVMPNSLLVLVDLLHRYHEYIALFPFLAFDVVTRMSDLLDEYEGQTAAMVLGARAVERGTLSTITTQHLCVASQCVSFLIDFIPALQAHLAAAIQGSAIGGLLRGPSAHNELAVANALGLVGWTSSPPAPSDSSSPTTAPDTKLFIKNDWNRIVQNSLAHRNEFFSKMGSLVYRKVDSLGHLSMQKGRWPPGGNEWVMAMLREVARLMRVLRPLLPPRDMDGVIVPLLGSLSVMLRQWTVQVPTTAEDDHAAAASDVMLFTANVEKFGYDVLKCAEVASVSAVMQRSQSFAPVSSEEAVLLWFLPPPPGQPDPACSRD